jgi:hypothetical protein
MFQASVKTNLVDTNVYKFWRERDKRFSRADGAASCDVTLPVQNAGFKRPVRRAWDLLESIICFPLAICFLNMLGNFSRKGWARILPFDASDNRAVVHPVNNCKLRKHVRGEEPLSNTRAPIA